jgi:hypothetical protein
VTATAIENPVRNLWRALPYAGHTRCASCDEEGYCHGASPTMRICVTCFEFVFGCVAPRRKR